MRTESDRRKDGQDEEDGTMRKKMEGTYSWNSTSKTL
jgi:hypothetical protein